METSGTSESSALVLAALTVAPLKRNTENEKLHRVLQRRVQAVCTVIEEVKRHGMILVDPFQSGLALMGPWDDAPIETDHLRAAVLSAVGRLSMQPEEGASLTWDVIMETLMEVRPATGGNDAGAAVTDDILDSIRAQELNEHEQRLVQCIVDKSKLAATTFDKVHLPASTIDAIRTMISLPLLYPDAYATGILKEHATQGALLFGPPGTGKTLLARAIANECGARVLAVQVSMTSDRS